MNYLETFKPSGRVDSFRKVVISKELTDYKKNLKRLAKLKKDLIALEEKIYGSVEDIHVYTTIYYRGKNIGEIIITPWDSKISVNEFLIRQYGNGRVLREEGVLSKNFPLSDIGLDNEKFLIALRRLFKSKTDESYKIRKDYENAIVAKFKKENPEEYKMGGRPCFDFEQPYGISQNYRIEKFFEMLIPNIDIVTILLNYLESNKDVSESEITNIIERINEFLPLIIKPDALCSASECMKYIKSTCSWIKYSSKKTSCEDALEVFKIIKDENEKAREELENHPEYEEIKREYLDLLERVQNFECKYLNF